MLIIYKGSRPLFPLLACDIHLEKQSEATETIALLYKSDWDWRSEPMKIVGIDNLGHKICCLVHGKYGEMYDRALSGIADIFQLDRRIIDVDQIVVKSTGICPWEISCLDLFPWLNYYYNEKKNDIIAALRPYIVQEAGDNR